MANIKLPTTWAAGLLKSVNIESCSQAEINELPILLIYAVVKDSVQSETKGWTEVQRDLPKLRLRFKVPVQDLETPCQCVIFAESCLRSAQLKLVACETENPKFLVEELIWNLKEKWESGETCNGVIEMEVIRFTELRESYRRRMVEMWVNSIAKPFKGATEEGCSSSGCCAICLNDFDERSVVLELPCMRPHVFHRECITAWLAKKSVCPLCRNPVRIRCGFWVQKKKWPHSGSTKV